MDCGIERRISEEAIVEKGTFKNGVDEKVEGVPDEEDPDAARSIGRESAEREDISGNEEDENGE